jgi:L-fuconolactonase
VTTARRIDAHQHFWKISRGDYGWLTPDLGPLYRDFGPDDLLPHVLSEDVDATVVVQAAPTLEETDFLVDLADRTPFVAGIVGWIPMGSPEGIEAIDHLAGCTKFSGVRPMIQDIADDGWMLRRELEEAFRILAERGLTFDALVKPRHLPHLLRLLGKHPDLRVVVDHAAKPTIPSRGDPWEGDEAWRRDMRAIARGSAAHCKLSGLVTEAPPEWTVEDLRPVVEFLLEEFGPRRLLWGSDWPVVELAGGYAAWRSATEWLLAGLSEQDRDAILGENAIAFYDLLPFTSGAPSP